MTASAADLEAAAAAPVVSLDVRFQG